MMLCNSVHLLMHKCMPFYYTKSEVSGPQEVLVLPLVCSAKYDTLPSVVNEISHCSTSSPTLGVVCLFNLSYSIACVVLSHCYFNLYLHY
jgi:hypothetical protein